MHRPVLVTAPAMLPVSLVEAKLHLRVDHNVDDALIEGLVRAATEHFDGWTGILGRCLVEQEWSQMFDGFARELPLSLAPVISISSVTVGSEAIDSGSYSLKVDSGGNSRVMFDDVSTSGVTSVVYKAGYATIPEVPAVPGDGEEDPGTPAIPAKSTVPDPLKVAILLLVGHWYQNREASITAAINELPFAVDALIAPYRRVGV